MVSKGKDDFKDQSYVLWGVSQKNLSRTLLPLGDYHKTEIRELATKSGFDELAKKSESYEICFIPDNDYRSFLKRKVNGLEQKVAGGQFVTVDGKPIGTHKGYPFYTVGQRKGLDIAVGTPLYVTKIIPSTNTVVLGEKKDLEKQEMWVKDINFVKYAGISEEMEAITKIRYKDKGAMSDISMRDGMVKVVFRKPVAAIAPGQSAVFYEGDDLLGGGLICD